MPIFSSLRRAISTKTVAAGTLIGLLVAAAGCAEPALAPAAAEQGETQLPALRTELLERVQRDQGVRNELIAKGVAQPDPQLTARMLAIDAENTARMSEIIREHGWPGPQLVGRDGSQAAWLLVQHADLALQKQALPLVEAAYKKGEARGDNYALLIDRVRTKEGKLQVYGSQTYDVSQWKNGEPAPLPMEDPANVDKRRAARA